MNSLNPTLHLVLYSGDVKWYFSSFLHSFLPSIYPLPFLSVHILITHTLAKVFLIELLLQGGRDTQLVDKHTHTHTPLHARTHTHTLPSWSLPPPAHNPAFPVAASSVGQREWAEFCRERERVRDALGIIH